jgi:hypothetical protein
MRANKSKEREKKDSYMFLMVLLYPESVHIVKGRLFRKSRSDIILGFAGCAKAVGWRGGGPVHPPSPRFALYSPSGSEPISCGG